MAAGLTVLLAGALVCSGCKGGNDMSEITVSEVITEEVSATENSEQPSVEKSEKDSGKSTEKESEKKSEKQSEKTSEKTSEKEAVSGKTPVEIHGALSVKGNQIVDESGKNFQICGVSTHGLGWFPEYVNKEAAKSLRDDFGANTLRLAMYTAEGGGYCTGGDKSKLKNIVNNGVSYATENGMYVIIDWHILHDLDPNVYKDDAKAFFKEMSEKYADNKNVIYEICNEPNGGTTWAQVKSYATEIIPVIRANDPDAIIVVGTPTWSQDVDEAIKDPIKEDNIVYAVHFYADTHKDDIRNKVKKAEDAGYPVLISEFSICDASGNGFNNVPEANTWISLLDQYGIGFVAWNLSNKNESSSLIAPSCRKTSGWSYDELSESGQWLVGVFDKHSDQGSVLAKGKTPTTKDTGGGDGNGQQSVGETASATSGNLEVKASAANSWQEGSDTCTQYALYIRNKAGSDQNGWTVSIDFKTPVSVSQIWGGSANVSGNVVTITPESYNGTISAGATLSDVGLIVKTAAAPSGISVSVK